MFNEKEYQKNWSEKNKEERKEYRKIWYQENRERIRIKNRMRVKKGRITNTDIFLKLGEIFDYLKEKK